MVEVEGVELVEGEEEEGVSSFAEREEEEEEGHLFPTIQAC